MPESLRKRVLQGLEELIRVGLHPARGCPVEDGAEEALATACLQGGSKVVRNVCRPPATDVGWVRSAPSTLAQIPPGPCLQAQYPESDERDVLLLEAQGVMVQLQSASKRPVRCRV